MVMWDRINKEDEAVNLDRNAYFRSVLSTDISKLFGRNDCDIRIGIWGAAGAGKTTYLVRLFDALEASKDWTVSVDAGHGRELLEESQDVMLNAGRFPALTDPHVTPEIFNYIITPQRRGIGQGIKFSQIKLDFLDAPGEFYEDFKKRKSENDIVDYLLSCDGIIFLIDPNQKLQRRLSTLLGNLFRELEARAKQKIKSNALQSKKTSQYGKLEQYMAFCVTKIDDSTYWERRNDSHKLMHEVASKRFFHGLKNYCHYVENSQERKKYGKYNRCEFFCLSSIGRYFDGDDYTEVVFEETLESISESESSTAELDSAVDDQNNENVSGWNDYDFKMPTTSQNNTQSEQKQVIKKINSDLLEEVSGYGLIEPLEWLIRRIQFHKPTMYL